MSLKINRWLHQRGFSRKKIRGSWLHQNIGDSLLAKELWSLQADSVARAWLIGTLVTIVPFLPFQSFIAVPLAILFRANVPITYALQWVSNPLTAWIHLPACYFFGCLLMNQSPSTAFHDAIESVQNQGWKVLGSFSFSEVLAPLFVGAAGLGIVIGVVGYFLIIAYWKRPMISSLSRRPDSPSPSSSMNEFDPPA